MSNAKVGARQPVSHWWRIGASVVAGGAASIFAVGRLKSPGASVLIGWDAAALVFLVLTGALIFTSNEPLVRARAKQEDESRVALMILIILAIVASMGAIVLALRDVQVAGKSGLPPWLVALASATLVLGWLVVQALFTLHYAHRYFADRDDDGQKDGGVQFPGEPPTSYRDFLYMAVCIGATCQVSDFDITSSKVRNLVTTHALVAFGFNTMVLALGINMIAGLIGGH